MKTIFISIYDGDTEKNILQSDVLGHLKESGSKIVLLSRDRTVEGLRKYASANVFIETIPSGSCFSERLFFWLGWNAIPTDSIKIRRHKSYLRHRNLIRYKLEQFLGFLGMSRSWRGLLRFLYNRIPDSYGSDLFDAYKPDVLFAPNMFSYEDGRLLRQAKRRNVKTVTTSKSWDVLMNKAFTKVIADKILVQNQTIKNVAHAIGDYPEDRIVIVGFVQFDLYTDPSIIMSRDAFCEQIGADPARKIILYSTSGDWKNPYDNEVVAGIHEAMEKEVIREPSQILVRFHPKYPSAVEKLNLPHLVKDRPCESGGEKEASLDGVTTSVYSFTFGRDDVIHLANTLFHSDVTINTVSTMTLDAIAFDKPVILVRHDGLDRKLGYWQSIRCAFDDDHYKDIVSFGAASVSNSMAETIELINTYLNNPAMNAEKRATLRRNVFYMHDGNSGKRIAEEVLSML